MRWDTLLRKRRKEHEKIYMKKLLEADRKVLVDPQIISKFSKKDIESFHQNSKGD